MINNELQDRAWRLLPSEVKNVAADRYMNGLINSRISEFEAGAFWTLRELFGRRNLTAEVEEEKPQDILWSLLTPKMQTYCRNAYHTSHDGNVEDILERLFGVEHLNEGWKDRLPDNEPEKRSFLDRCYNILDRITGGRHEF